ncbi:serine hydrolase [Shouchella sp. 1P09AA]|uniref:serine hydrolase domain-containing protein n=1 Tax=unclassified Shouchella TaxID=2893065 RepID=UPI0039A29D32
MNTHATWSKLFEAQRETQFSGSIYVSKRDQALFSDSFGYAIHSEKIKNQPKTRFSIASGCKIFTSVAICQLVAEGKLAFTTKLKDCVAIPFPHFDDNITIHHLLTHTSGIPDYFDESEMDDYEELWIEYPMYRVQSPRDFLPLFQHKPMKKEVGSPFTYNNSGYILLGLVIEEVSGIKFVDYVEEKIFKPAGMSESGYFSADALPADVSIGYIKKTDGTWKTNIFSLPATGGPDGGAYVTAPDIGRFWKALMNEKLLSGDMVRTLMTPHVPVDDDLYYAYGGFQQSNESGMIKYIQMGYDPGVNYRSVYYPKEDLTIVVCSNKSDGAFEILEEVEQLTVHL